MTRPQIRLYWFFLNKRKFKEIERQAMMMWGYDPGKRTQSRKQRDLAAKWIEDPLFGFPNDIIYFDRGQIDAKLSVSRRFWDKFREEARWDRLRAEACLGRQGIVARRCSMNDKLWGIYGKAKQRHVTLTLDDIKRMILIDIKRSKLYPPGWTDDSVDPPEWYLEQLREQGLLDKILKEIDGVGRA